MHIWKRKNKELEPSQNQSFEKCYKLELRDPPRIEKSTNIVFDVKRQGKNGFDSQTLAPPPRQIYIYIFLGSLLFYCLELE
jgi:hypothetical protein